MSHVGESPKNLTQAMDWFENKLSDKNRAAYFKSMSESDMSAALHHSAGRSLRNTLYLWNPKSQMFKYFKSIGITHADDMSSIILMSLYRRINGNPIEVEDQVKHYQNFWKERGFTSGMPE